MHTWEGLRFRLERLLRRREAEADLEAEIRSHIEIEAQQNIDRGMTAEGARRAARLKFGSAALAQEDSRAQWGWLWAERLWQDVRCGARMFAKSPGFTATAVTSLGLGIGASTAIFSILNLMFAAPLPYPAGDRLVVVMERELGKSAPEGLWDVSMLNYRDWKAQSRSFESLGHAWRGIPFVLNQPDRAVEVIGEFVSEEYLPMLDARACLGRLFAPEDYRPGVRAAVLSHGGWQRLFGSSRSVIGRSFRLDGTLRQIVGVMCPDFPTLWGEKVDLWLAFDWLEKNRGYRRGTVVGRMKPGSAVTDLQAELDVIAARLERQYPEQKGFGVRVQPLRQWLYADYEKRFLTFFAAVVLVLLIACTNIANLLAARATGREREMAVRASLGAGRSRLIRQLLTESALLSCAGTAFGLLLAQAAVRLGARLSPEYAIPTAGNIPLDARVFGFAALLAALSAALFGLWPALRMSRPDLNEGLKDAGRHRTVRTAWWRPQAGLVIAQIALSLVLLAGAGLIIHNIWRQLRVPVGCNLASVLQIYTQLTRAEYLDESARPRRIKPKAALTIQALESRLQTIAGVSGVSLSGWGVLGGCSVRPTSVGGALVARDPAQRSCYDPVSPSYFDMLEIPVLKGRVFSERNSRQSVPVAVVNESFAKRHFPGEDVVGQVVNIGVFDGSGAERREIVGVVGDVRQRPSEAARPAVYYPFAQRASECGMGTCFELLGVTFVVRSSVDPAAIRPAAERAFREIAPDVLADWIVTEDDIRWWATRQPRFYGWLLGIFAGTALLLASVGIFGVTSYTVAQRRHEIGIRIALGAQPSEVLRLILRGGVPPMLIGIAIGLSGALALARVLEAWLADLRLNEVKPSDPVTLGLVCTVIAGVGLLACLIPAHRAARTDPTSALRCE